MAKFKEFITEPSMKYVNTNFTIKVKVDFSITCYKLKNSNILCSNLKKIKCLDLTFGGDKNVIKRL